MSRSDAEPGREACPVDEPRPAARLVGRSVVRLILLAAIVFGILGVFDVWGHGTLQSWSQIALAAGCVGSFAVSYGPQVRRAWNAQRS